MMVAPMEEEKQLHALLRESVKLGRENNALLKKLVWANRRAMLLTAFYWLLIIGATFGSYFFLEPYFGWIRTIINNGKDVSHLIQTVEGK